MSGHRLQNIWRPHDPKDTSVGIDVPQCSSCNLLPAFLDQIIILAVIVHQSSRYVLKMMEIYICHTEKFAEMFWVGIWENAGNKLQCNHLWLSTSIPGTKCQSDLEIFCNLWGYLNCRRFHGFHGNGNTHLTVVWIFVIRRHSLWYVSITISSVALGYDFGQSWGTSP